MTLPKKSCQQWRLVIPEKCKICSIVFSNVEICEHFNVCYDHKIQILFSEFDLELTKIKKYYENNLKIFTDVINLSDLCKKCEFLSCIELEIEECHLVVKKIDE